MSYGKGRQFEDGLITRLDTLCVMQRNQELDHEYKLDFVITKFKEIPKFTRSIGVQVTTRLNETAKQQEFLRKCEQHVVTPRSVYLEVDEKTPVTAAAQIAYAAFVALLYDESHRGEKIIGLRIDKSLDFHFFDLADRLEQAHASTESASKEGQTLQGIVKTFDNERCFGFIETDGDLIESFFFHRSNAEHSLMDRLGNEASNGAPNIPVEFEHGGRTERHKNPRAKNVRVLDTSATKVLPR